MARLIPIAPRGAILFLGTATLQILIGCAFPRHGPDTTWSTYALVEVAGDPLPALWLENDFGRLSVLADTLWLDGRGSGRRRAVFRWEPAGRVRGPEVREELRYDEVRFRYDLKDGRLVLEFPCLGFLSFALCAAPPHGTGELDDEGLRLDSLLGARAPLRYRQLHATGR